MAGHLTLEEREVIAQQFAAGSSQGAIAEMLERDPGTISRELRRNRSQTGYFPGRAQQQAQRRRSERPLEPKMQRPEISQFVREGLKQYWSPDQIACRAKLVFDDPECHVSHQTIYTWIETECARGRTWTRFLRRRGRPPTAAEKRGQIPNSASIDGRPKIVERRGLIGDFEGDTVRGPVGHGGLVTLVDRRSRLVLMSRVADLKADTVEDAAAAALQSVPRKARKTVTFDNGKEFATHERLARRAKVKVYFAKPYASWQRGTNENTNGLIRQYFPKGADLAGQSDARINQVQDLLNNRPRRCLGYRTPLEAFTGKSPCCI